MPKPLPWARRGEAVLEWSKGTLQRIERRRSAWRLPVLVVALLAFVVGTGISIGTLDLRLSDIGALPLLALALLVVPLTIAYSAINMVLMGKALGIRINAVTGVKISVFAQVAELLPIPGGAIIRTAALIRGGGGAWRSTGIVLAFSLLWIAFAAIGGGYALAEHEPIGMLLFAAGCIGAIAVNLWLALTFGWTIAGAATALRIVGLALVACRVVLTFAAIGMAISWSASLSFAFAVIVGSAASIVPGGLGVSEGLSALIAVPVGITPAAAFLAAALGRLIGFGGNMLVAGFFIWRNPPLRPEAANG